MSGSLRQAAIASSFDKICVPHSKSAFLIQNLFSSWKSVFLIEDLHTQSTCMQVHMHANWTICNWMRLWPCLTRSGKMLLQALLLCCFACCAIQHNRFNPKWSDKQSKAAWQMSCWPSRQQHEWVVQISRDSLGSLRCKPCFLWALYCSLGLLSTLPQCHFPTCSCVISIIAFVIHSNHGRLNCFCSEHGFW